MISSAKSKFRHRFLPTALVLGLFLVCHAIDSACAVNFRVEPIVISGELAPDGTRKFQSFVGSGSLLANDAGQVAFGGNLSDASSGVFVDQGSTRAELVRIGEAVPNGNGRFRIVSDSRFNQAGQFAFRAFLSGTVGGTEDGHGVYVGDGTNLREIARAGRSVPGGNGVFDRLGMPKLNNGGQIAFAAGLRSASGGEVAEEAIFAHDGNTLSQLARTGETVDGGDGRFSTFSLVASNDLGQVAFRSTLTDTSAGIGNNTGIFVHDGAAPRTILRKGDSTPTGDGVLSPVAAEIDINNSGEVLFRADVMSDGTTTIRQGFYRSDGTTLAELVRSGQPAPGGNGSFSGFPTIAADTLNDAGQAVFFAQLAGTTGLSRDDAGLYRSDGQALVEIAREGRVAPDGNGVLSMSIWPVPQINDAGQVAFQVGLTDVSIPVQGVSPSAIYLFDDSLGLVQVARAGQPLFGSTINVLNRPEVPGRGGGAYRPVGLSNSGPTRVWFEFSLADGRSGIAVWTLVPEPSSLLIVAVGGVAILLASGWPNRR